MACSIPVTWLHFKHQSLCVDVFSSVWMVSLGSNRVTAQKKTLSPTPNTVSILASQLRNTLLLLHVKKKLLWSRNPCKTTRCRVWTVRIGKKMDSTKKSRKTRRRMKKAISHRCLKPCSDTRGRFEDFKKNATCENHQGEEWSHHCRCEAHCSTILGKLERWGDEFSTSIFSHACFVMISAAQVTKSPNCPFAFQLSCKILLQIKLPRYLGVKN